MTIRGGYKFTELFDIARKIVALRWGGIKCRVAFFMVLSLVLASALVIATFVWNAKFTQKQELLSRAFKIGEYISSVVVDDDGISKNHRDLHRKASALLSSIAADSQEYGLLSLDVYDRSGILLFHGPPTEFNESIRQKEQADPADRHPASEVISSPQFRWNKDGILDFAMPLNANEIRVGDVRMKLAGNPDRLLLRVRLLPGIVILGGLVLIGLIFSQLIAIGITLPLARLSVAVEQLSKQKWKTPLAVQGSDEFGRLIDAFNTMAKVLNDREVSLSRGNRDLFILHTAGLDLMESLELELLLKKISARSADLVRADTAMIASIDKTSGRLRYMGGEGSNARLLNVQDTPFETGGIFNWFASYGTPLLISDAQSDFRLDGDLMKSLGINSILSVPLWSSNIMVGILTMVNKKGGAAFDKQDLRLLTIFSNLAGSALQNAFLYDDLKQKIGELGTAQQQLVQSTKMAAVGELAANIAHEINNPLTSVLGYASHLLKSLAMPDEPRKKLKLMEQETLRVRKIIRNLLDFSHSRPTVMQSGDLLQPMKETVALLRGVADQQNVKIFENYPSEPMTVMMDHNELKQVFINIINNAFHAMPDGGDLTISIDRNDEDHVMIVIADTGKGIASGHMKKIFEPFFSTKSRGDGTGLGLSISSRIINNHGGKIEVESPTGRGARFTLYLPIVEMSVLETPMRGATSEAK